MDFEKMLGILVFFTGITVLLVAGGFAMVALIDRVRRKQAEWKHIAAGGDLVAEFEELRMRVEDLERRGLASGEVEAQYSRLAELEERLDFAERLLARPDMAPQGKGSVPS